MSRLAILHQQMKKAIGGRSVPRLSIAGNVFTVVDGENEQNVSAMDKENNNQIYVDVHIIDASPFKAKIFYPGKYDPKADPAAPSCYSDDGERPALDSTDKQSELCAQCPQNAWGSATTDDGKKAKACRDAWKVAVIVLEHHTEKPLSLRIPPNSLQNWLAYVAQFNDYPLGDRKMNVSDVITRVFFETGKLGTLAFMPLSVVDADQRAVADGLLAEKATDEIIGLGNMSEEKQAEVLALSAPTGQPQVTHVKREEPKQVAAPVKQPEPAPEPQEPEEPKPVSRFTSKATNAVLPSEGMRTKTQMKKPAEAAPMPTNAAGKKPLGENVKNMLSNIMGMPT